MVILTTPRLLVRQFAPRDLSDYLDYQGRPEVIRYSGAHPATEAEAIAFLTSQENAGNEARNYYHSFAVQHRGEGKVIGDIGLWLDGGPEGKADLGFQFHPDYHGQGYGTEAAQAFLGYAFRHWDLHRITAGCSTRNEASRRLIRRLGMRQEAHFIQSRLIQGELHDEIYHAILRSEWEEEADSS